MVMFNYFFPQFSSPWIAVFADALSLLAFLTPIIYFSVYLPLALNIKEHKYREKELKLLETMTRLIAESYDFETALKITLESVCKTTGWVLGETWMPSPDRKHLELFGMWHIPNEGLKKFIALSRKFTFPPGTGLPGRVWSSKEPAWIKNVTEDQNFPRSSLTVESGLKGALAIPILLDNGEVFAVIDFFMFKPLGEKDERVIRRISSTAIHLGAIIQRKLTEDALQKAHIELERRNFEIHTLAAMSDKLHVSHTPEEAYTVISQSISWLFPNGALFIYTPSRNLLNLSATWGNFSLTLEEPLSPNDCYALRLGKPHLFMDAQSDIQCHCVGKITNPYLCVPLMGHGEIFGLLYLSFEPNTLINKDQIEAKRQLAIDASERIGLALANLNLRSALRNMSVRDILTGLYNRRYMEESLEREIYRANRKGASLGIVMLDIDHFKRFNDTFGHEAGDAVLHEIGALLQQCIRSSDIACRYGGEEFILILPEATLEMTRLRAEKLREMVKCIHMQINTTSLGPVTVSFGVAAFPDHGATTEVIVKMADLALYKAKAEGRDRVCVAMGVNRE